LSPDDPSYVQRLASSVKKVDGAGICNFPTGTADFCQGARIFNFAPKFLQNGGRGFQPQILHFWTKFFGQEDFPINFWQPKIQRG